MTIWRVQLKPDPTKGIDYTDILNFCQIKGIIGVGWCKVTSNEDDYDSLKANIESIVDYKGDNGKYTGAIKAINAMRKMQPGDLVWTRLAKTASEYYLCRVGDRLWKDRVVTDEHIEHDIGNFVSAKWLKVGTEDKVPGKVVNSFCSRGAVQQVHEVNQISQYIWDQLSNNDKSMQNEKKLTWPDFWTAIGSEELECLVFLYLQKKLGYLVYSSTLKKSTARYEAIMISSDGTHRCYPQVKREESLDVESYINDVKGGDKVFLFTTSEKYGITEHNNIHCIKKDELQHFILDSRHILPENILYWVDIVK